MIAGKNILSIVPARIGSKGIVKKNLKKIKKKSLVSHAIICLKKIRQIDRIFISTDSNLIVKEALKFNISTPFLRTKRLAGDRISDYQVISDVLKKIEKLDKKNYDIILLIQPTSPFRKASDIVKCIKMLINKKSDSVWTVSKSDPKTHPLKQLSVVKNRVNFYEKSGKKIIARQQLHNLYHRNGICYAIKRETILKQKNIMGKFCIPLIINRININIDNYFDLKLANLLYR
jgi:CMP-N,N'-diacetyllegionaminic acid synthase